MMYISNLIGQTKLYNVGKLLHCTIVYCFAFAVHIGLVVTIVADINTCCSCCCFHSCWYVKGVKAVTFKCVVIPLQL